MPASCNENSISGNSSKQLCNGDAGSQLADSNHLLPTLAAPQKMLSPLLVGTDGTSSRTNQNSGQDLNALFLTSPFAQAAKPGSDISNSTLAVQPKPSPYDEVAKRLSLKYDIQPLDFVSRVDPDKLIVGHSIKSDSLVASSASTAETVKNFNGYRGEGIHRDVPQGEAHVVDGDSLQGLARKHLGKHASAQEVIKYATEIAETNYGGDVHHVIHPGDTVKLPGHTKDGAITYEGSDGRNITVKSDGTAVRESDKQHQARAKDNTDRSAEAAEHKKLEAEADKLSEPQRSRFKKDMKEFERRADKDNLSPQEVTDTYKQLERMLEAQGDKPMTAREREKVASQVMHRAAHPTETNQGYHGTCNVATVEVRTYTKHPSDAARLVADVSLTGQYTAKDGTVVHQDSIYHGDANGTNKRDHASEIFQVTAVNIHYAQENAKTNPPGQLRYVQLELKPPDNLHDTGERVMDFSKNKPNGEEYKVDGKPAPVPGLTDNDVCTVSQAITGSHDKGMLFAAPEGLSGTPDDDHIVMVHSEAELEQKLAAAKASGQMPIIVQVFCNNEPFYSDENHGQMEADPGSHVVTISDYQPGPPALVKMNNQWGPDTCHAVSAHDLYRAMKVPAESIKDLQKDVDWNRAHHQVDYQKEFELLDLKRNLHQINDADYEQQLKVLMKGMKKHFDQDHPSEQERGRDLQKMNDAINELPPAARIRLYQEALNDGVIDQATAADDVALAGWQARQDFSQVTQTSDTTEQARMNLAYEEATVELNRLLQQLPEAERMQILNQIKDWSTRYKN